MVEARAVPVFIRLPRSLVIVESSVVIAEAIALSKVVSPAEDGPAVLVPVCRKAATAARYAASKVWNACWTSRASWFRRLDEPARGAWSGCTAGPAPPPPPPPHPPPSPSPVLLPPVPVEVLLPELLNPE